jgi:hypothetical protein
VPALSIVHTVQLYVVREKPEDDPLRSKDAVKIICNYFYNYYFYV